MVQVAQLTRDLNFKVQFKVTLLSSLISAIIAIYLASLGFGVWSLAAQMLVVAFAGTILYWIVNYWRPIKTFSKESLHEMFGFGSKLFLSSLIDMTFQNIYIIVIGKLFLATYVGYYFFAQQIQQVIVQQLTNSVQKVTYPALSTMQDNNKALKNFYAKVIQVVIYITTPSMFALIVLAEPLFNVILKNEWMPAVPYLQLLCIVGVLYPLHAINLNILKVKGRSDLFLYLEVIKKLMIVVVLSISVQFGIFGILVGQIVSSVLAYIPNSYYSIKLIDYTLFEQMRDFIPTFILSFIMGTLMYLSGMLLPFGNIIYIIVTSFVGIISYISLNYLLKTPSQLLVSEIIKDKLNKRF
jgi:O-antigen/teichoic acid export membrane protein